MPEEPSTYVSNVTSSAGSAGDGTNNNVQEYGVKVQSLNESLHEIFGEDDITYFNSTGVGIFSGRFPNGVTGWFTSRTIAKTIDLVGEGQIEGIVSGEWIPNTSKEDPDMEGQIGWKRMKFEPYVDGDQPESFLRSIYLNDTPIVNSYGQYNFQNVEVAIANGTPSGVGPDDNFLYVGESNKLEKTRTINERLRGPDIGGTDENPWYYHPKIYRILNPQADKIKVNIKIASLFYTKQGDEFEISEWGQTVGSTLTFKFRYRPIYKDKNGIMDLNVSRDWVNPRTPITSSVTGLVKSAYIHPVVISIDDDLRNEFLAGFEVEVTRTTLDSIESNVSNQTFVDAITTVFDDTLSYPNSAIVSMNFNAEYFSQIPTRAYDMRMLRVKVPGGPGGYDPITRTYNESPWEGDFHEKKQWTNNPAWIFYDLLSNERYGVGKYLSTVEIDKWTLYEISKFCDVLVPDGEKGLEPRFTCNTLVNTREDAYKVLQDFASVFRAIVYYGLGSIHTAMDKPRSPIAQFTNVNVEDGNFTYTSSSKNTVHTVCIVRYNDKDNFYKPAIEYVENSEGIRKYGVVEKEITAFACTSRSQAVRLGRWILATESAENELIQFNTGPEAALLRPGDLVKVNDENRSVEKYAGRLIDISENKVILDKDLSSFLKDDTNYQITVSTPGQYYDTSLVNIADQSEFSGIRPAHIQSFDFEPDSPAISISSTVINHSETMSGPVSGTTIEYAGGDPTTMFTTVSGHQLLPESTWSIADINNASNLFSITSVKEMGMPTYSVEGMVHNPQKYDYIESGIISSFVLSPPGTTEAPPAPHSVALGVGAYPGSTNSQRITVKVHNAEHMGTTIGYKIYAKTGADWHGSDTKTSSSSIPRNEFLFQTIYLDDQTDADGNPYTYFFPPKNKTRYFFRVFAMNSVGAISALHKDGKGSDPSNGIQINDHYPIKDVQINSLRLYTEFNPLGSRNSANKALFSELTSTAATVTWEATFFGQTLNSSALGVSFPISYRIHIHEPNTGSSTPLAIIKTFESENNAFNYSFAANTETPGGPRRHYDLTVDAVDEEGEVSSANAAGERFNNTTGWDIIEIHNPRPKGYCLTPRKLGGTRPGDPCAAEFTHTEQYIDKDGLIAFKFLSNSFVDLAGGYMYISKHPFSGNDFTADGVPLTVDQRPNIVLDSAEERDRAGEYQIIEAPFSGSSPLLPAEFSVSPPSVPGSADTFLFSDTYYMSIKFFDSFDRAVGDQGGDIDKSELWMGFARDNVDSQGNVTKLQHRFSNASRHYAYGDYENGTAKCCDASTAGTYAVPMTPTKFASAQGGGFNWWIRLNVNGQWEGQGISHVKTLTWKDVNTLYDYDGYYEYGCQNTEKYYASMIDDQTHTYYSPYDQESLTRCRFRMARLDPTANKPARGSVMTPSMRYYTAGPAAYMYWYRVTGATLPPGGIADADTFPLPKAGIGYGGWGDDTFQAEDDRINSYNERGQLIAGRSRPLRGFRRFRVYFDPSNLPPRPSEGQLSSYSVVGMNSWNGPYEAYPGDGSENTNIALAKDIAFTSPAGTSYGIFTKSVESYMNEGDLFENIPGVWNHHSAGFGQGFGGLIKTQKYFDVHLGRLIDDSYLTEGMFGVLSSNDYSILEQGAWSYDSSFYTLHESTYVKERFVTLPISHGGDSEDKYPDG